LLDDVVVRIYIAELGRVALYVEFAALLFDFKGCGDLFVFEFLHFSALLYALKYLIKKR